MEFMELLELKNDYKKYNTDNYFTLREFIEMFEEWNTEQRNMFYKLLDVVDIDFTRAINIIENDDYIIYDSLEDYIYTSLEEQGQELPSWLCISAYDTYFYSLRYEDNLYFLEDMPQFAKGSEEYGESASRQKWLDGIRYLVDNSEVILLID
jgi:hypothetical protein|nr:MAG TPA: hypothetical protein [Caudoviricetes sp.]